jgi:hypothetical protein
LHESGQLGGNAHVQLAQRPLPRFRQLEVFAAPILRIDLPHEAGIQSGVFGRAFLGRGEKKGLAAPKDALVTRGQLTGIYAVDANGLVHWRVLTLGKEIDNQVEVLSGLAEGDLVVLNPGAQELDGKKAAGIGEKRS